MINDIEISTLNVYIQPETAKLMEEFIDVLTHIISRLEGMPILVGDDLSTYIKDYN